ncbi:formimidoylglutamase [candidate division KSB1 bacterium]
MDIDIYFEPFNIPDYDYSDKQHRKRLGDVIVPHIKEGQFPDLTGIDIAIIGVNEDRRNVDNEGCAAAPDHIRKELYKLYQGPNITRIADLGNIKRGHEVEDTYYAVSTVLSELIKNKIIPVILGGSQDITYANYLAYESMSQIINIVSIDTGFDLGETEEDFDAQSYLSKIILHQPNYLFNYTNIGYQTFYVDQEGINLMSKLYFDTYRIGVVRANLEEVEPMIRNADMMTIDMSAIRHADAPGNNNATPNGFFGEEICQIIRYAGISDKLSSIGFYEMNPAFDSNNQTAKLIAQMIWYFIDGYYNRKNDFPFKKKEDYLKYIVPLKSNKNEITFYKSKKSDRWWMEVPCPTDLMSKFERHYLVACSYKDYQTATEDDIPDRWWQASQKLM